MATSLHVKYRPRDFDEVIGQDAAVAGIKSALKSKSSQAFIFGGPSGVGKTTLARNTAEHVGCDKTSILEIDAATNTGIQEMRKIQEMIQYRGFAGTGKRAVIIDECHRLSGNAWDSLLKVLEEPPAHAYWFLCTTNLSKVPTTVKTRCATVVLKSLDDDDLSTVLEVVEKEEKIKVPEGVRAIIIREAHGSPRMAINNLGMCRDAKTAKEAAEILRTVLETDAVLELCRMVVKGSSWVKMMAMVDELKGDNPEGVRIVVCNYLAKVLKDAKSDDAAIKSLRLLDAFSQPYMQAEQLAPLLLSIGRATFG